jgi:NADPH-dependent glutamate synthase beta subunit-like oxidoreductase
VYGGGDTAVDAARTAARLGATETLLVYRRTRDRMPAHAEETAAAEREGVQMHWLRTVSALGEDGLTVEEMEIGEDGRPRPTGRTETLAADSLILALGQQADTAFLRAVPGVETTADGSVVVSGSMMTGAPGVFAGGDVVPTERTVTIGVGHGKRAARAIDAWLGGQSADAGPKHPTATFDLLHPWYFGDTGRRAEPELPAAERVTGFTEVVGGLTAEQAVYEAGRCLSCGNCFECDGCFGACPEQAVIKVGPGAGYLIDQERCTGCGICADQCPVHAIEMIPDGGAADRVPAPRAAGGRV